MKQLVSIILAAAFLLSNLNWSLSWHSCKHEGHRQKIGVLVHDLECGMESLRASCEEKAPFQTVFKNEPCCEGGQDQIKGTDSGSLVSEIVPLFDLPFVFLGESPIPFTSSASVVASLKNFKQANAPPRPGSLIRVLFQVFRL